MKVALLAIVDGSNPATRFVQTMCPPLGLLSLQAYLARDAPGVEVRWFYDANEVLAWQPELVGLSSVTENFGLAESVAGAIREETTVPLLVGGPHISLLPHRLPPVFDVGVIGEGECTLLELVEAFRVEHAFSSTALQRIEGIAYHDGAGRTIVNRPREPVEPLDRLPHPIRNRLDESGFVHIMTSRGCPYRCDFCASPALWKTCRLFSAGHVADELSDIHLTVRPDHVKIFDDLFLADTRRVARIANLLRERAIAFERGLSGFARADLITPESIEAATALGIRFLSIGIESGSQAVLDRVSKGTSVASNQQALELCFERGISTCCSFVVGVPGESARDLDATLRFIDDNHPRIGEVEICPVIPFPRTKLWEDALTRGLVSETMDWSLLRDWSDFSEFNLDRYIYLNPVLDKGLFARYCERFKELYAALSAGRRHAIRTAAGRRCVS